MFQKLFIAGAALLGGGDEPTETLSNSALPAQQGNINPGIAQSELPLQLSEVRKGRGKSLEPLHNYKSNELEAIYQAYDALRRLSDPELALLKEHFKGMFARSDWRPPEDGRGPALERDDSGLIIYQSPGRGWGHAPYEMRAALAHFVAQTCFHAGLPSEEVKWVLTYMFQVSDGNPNLLDGDNGGGLFNIPKLSWSEMNRHLYPKSPGIEAARFDPLLHTLTFLDYYLDARDTVRRQIDGEPRGDGFITQVWEEYFRKVGWHICSRQEQQRFLSEQSERAKVIEEDHKLRLRQVSSAPTRMEREEAKQEADRAHKRALTNLERHAPELAQEYINNEMTWLEKGLRELRQKGAMDQPRGAHLDRYLALLEKGYAR